MKKGISEEEIERIAKLSRLKLKKEEKNLYQKQLSRIIEFMEKLKEVNTNKVSPTFYPLSIKNVMREDSNFTSLSQDEVLKNAPDKKNGYFKVPRIIE